MTWFTNLKISGKIITVVVANILLMLFLGAFAILELSKVNGSNTWTTLSVISDARNSSTFYPPLRVSGTRWRKGWLKSTQS